MRIFAIKYYTCINNNILNIWVHNFSDNFGNKFTRGKM